MTPTTCPGTHDSPGRASAGGWAAKLDLGFRHREDRTVLYRRRHRGPLLVQRPFYPADNPTCHVCLMHPPGGLVAGDRLEIRADLSPGARALITGPAAMKAYRSTGAAVHQNVTLTLRDGAILEWLPPETIFYDGARAHSCTRVDLDGNAAFLGWEVNCFGRPASAERFVSGQVRSDLELWRGGEPVWIDRGEFPGLAHSGFLDAPFGAQGRPVIGTLVACATEWDARAFAKHLVDEVPGPDGDGRLGVSGLDSVIVCRYLGGGTRAALETFRRLRAVLLPALTGAMATEPRLWNS